MGYTKSHFSGNVEKVGNGYVYTIDSDSGKTWLRINIDKDEDTQVIVELQYIIANLKQFIISITDSAITGKGDGIYIDAEED